MRRIALALLLLATPAHADEDEDRAAQVRADDAAIDAAVRSAIERVSASVVEVETLGAMPEKIVAPKKGEEGRGGTSEGVLAKKGFKQAFGPQTGLAISKDLVVTSTFAIQREPRHVFVTRKDGKAFVATILGKDEGRQIALLRVEGADLTPAPEAKRESVRVGRTAIALGRGHGIPTPAISVGIVSATDRIGGKAIQTSASISPANYGGPLVSIDGEVMGVLAPLAPAGGMAGVDLYDSGIGFAVPLEDVRALLPRLEKGEKLKPGFLGVSVDQARTEDGILVEMVQPGSPADKAGLKKKDLIVGVDGKPVHAYFQLQHALGRHAAGDRVKITVQRGKAQVELEAELTEPPPPPPPGALPPGMPGGPPGPPGPQPKPPPDHGHEDE